MELVSVIELNVLFLCTYGILTVTFLTKPKAIQIMKQHHLFHPSIYCSVEI